MKIYYKSLAVLLSVCVLSSCSGPIHFTRSLIVPAAEGTVRVKKDKNSNYSIQVKVRHLAPVGNLQTPANTYVVWMGTAGQNDKNIGQIKSSSSGLSHTLKGSVKSISSFEPHKIFITAENDGAIRHPQGQVVLTTENF